MDRPPRILATLVVLAVAVLAGGVPVAHAAGTLTPVSGFGANPGALNMYSYVPTGLPTGRPLVVALHGCTQSAADYYGHSGWPKYADLFGFALVLPEQTSANNANSCFNWFQTGDTSRGAGEALSIKQMVDYALTHYGSDPSQVYVTGLSAGGAMTAVMLAAYPDVFAGGAIVAGLPYRCATDLSSAFSCQYTAMSKTPAQWGDLVRAANPGYGGPWPRVAIWYGTSDTTVNPANATESRDQWTNVWGIPATPSSTTSLPGNTTLETYSGGAVALYRVQGIGHGTPVDPGTAASQCGTTGTYYLQSICSSYYTAQFWGLVGSTPPPPPSPTPTPSASGGACFTASNYQQTVDGRAHQSGGYTYANGSNQAMGLWNTFVVHTLRQTGPNAYVLADTGCH